MRFGVENVTVERQRVILGKNHEQVFEALADEKGLHLVEAFRLNLGISVENAAEAEGGARSGTTRKLLILNPSKHKKS